MQSSIFKYLFIHLITKLCLGQIIDYSNNSLLLLSLESVTNSIVISNNSKVGSTNSLDYLTNAIQIDYFYSKNIIISKLDDKGIYLMQLNNSLVSNGHVLNQKLIASVNIYHMCSDWINDLIYFTNENGIYVIPINKTWFEALIYEFSIQSKGPHYIAVNPLHRFILWCDGFILYKANQDGSNSSELIQHNTESHDFSTVIDYYSERIFFTKSATVIWSIDYYGSDSRIVFESHIESVFFRFDKLDKYLYIGMESGIKRVDISGQVSNNSEVIIHLSNSSYIHTIKSYAISKQPNGLSSCENSKCTAICIPKNKIDVKCVKPLNVHEEEYFEINANNFVVSLMLLSNDSLDMISLNKMNALIRKHRLFDAYDYFWNLFDNQLVTDSIEYDFINKRIIWIENSESTKLNVKVTSSIIYYASIAERILNKQIIYKTNSTFISGLTFDWIHSLIYYVTIDSIKVFNTNRPDMVYSIVENRNMTNHIQISPIESFIIYAEKNKTREGYDIIRVNQDGSDPTQLNGKKIRGISVLTIDVKEKRVYYFSTSTKHLYKLNYIGIKPFVFEKIKLKDYAMANSLQVIGNIVYYLNHTNSDVLMKWDRDNEYNTGFIRYSKLKAKTIKLIHPDLWPNGSDHCWDNDCKYLCIPRNLTTYSCVCNNDILMGESNCNNSVHQIKLRKDGEDISYTIEIIAISISIVIIILGIIIILTVRKLLQPKTETDNQNDLYYEDGVGYDANDKSDYSNIDYSTVNDGDDHNIDGKYCDYNYSIPAEYLKIDGEESNEPKYTAIYPDYKESNEAKYTAIYPEYKVVYSKPNKIPIN